MIEDSSLTAIGRVVKTHGIHGEMNVELYDSDRVSPDGLRCVVFNMDGINVPFFISSWRERGRDAWLIILDDVTGDAEAAAFVGKEIFALTADIPHGEEDDDYLTLDDLVGYNLYDTDGAEVGRIADIDDSTPNVLFIVDGSNGIQIHVPAAEPLIVAVDPGKQTLTMNLPSGLY